jgi:hypothetical protein
MAEANSEQIKAFLERLGERYSRRAKLILLGRGALCLLGNPRPTVDIDYVGNDLQKDELQGLMDEIAGEMGFEAEAVPIQEFTPLALGDEKREIPVGTFGKLEVSIIDPYVIALTKLDRGFDTDLEDVIFLIHLPQLEQVIQDALPQAGKFDMDSHKLQEHLQAVRDALEGY